MCLVVGEADQGIMVHQVEVVATVRNKPEVKEARTVMAKIVLVWPVGTQMMMALFHLIELFG